MTLVKLNNKANSKPFNFLFDEFFNDLPAVLGKEWNLNVPPVNITETGDAYHLELSAPGRNKEDFKVNIEKGLLTISFEKKKKPRKTIQRTFARNSAIRVLLGALASMKKWTLRK